MNTRLTAQPTDYSYTVEHGVICVVDHSPVRCVTDDVENIVAHLRRGTRDLENTPIIYRNTLGVWHQIVVTDGQFDGFWAIGERHKAIAIGMVYPGFEWAGPVIEINREEPPEMRFLGERMAV